MSKNLINRVVRIIYLIASLGCVITSVSKGGEDMYYMNGAFSFLILAYLSETKICKKTICTIVEEVPGCEPHWYIRSEKITYPFPQFDSLTGAKHFCINNDYQFKVEYYEP